MRYIIILLFISNLSSCDFPEHYFTDKLTCEKTKIQMNYDSPEYSLEKVNTILRSSNPSEYRYYFKTFVIEDGKDKVLVNFRDEQLCMDVLLSIDKLGKLTGMKRTNGRSYPKELYDLKWKLRTINEKQDVVYLDMHDIID